MKSKRYDARFFNEPTDLPDYFYWTYGKTSYEKLIAWAKKEYDDALRFFSRRGAWKTVEFYANEVSPMRVLAMLPDFHRLMSLMTQETWNQLKGRDRVFLRRAYEIYNVLKLQSWA